MNMLLKCEEIVSNVEVDGFSHIGPLVEFEPGLAVAMKVPFRMRHVRRTNNKLP